MRKDRLVITTLVDLPFGPRKPIGGNTSGLLAGLTVAGSSTPSVRFSRGGRWTEWCRDSAGSRRGALGSEQSFERWFDNSSTALSNQGPDGTFACGVLGANEYRVVKSRFHDVNEPSEPQWSFLRFKNNRTEGM
jgi:hypothetical protein